MASSACSATHPNSCRPPRTGPRWCTRMTSPCSSSGSITAHESMVGAPVPHPPPRRSLHHAARFTLHGARRRRQGGAHRGCGHRHQRAGARPGGAALLAGTAADGGRGHQRLAHPGGYRAARAVHQPRHPRAVARKHRRPAPRGNRGTRTSRGRSRGAHPRARHRRVGRPAPGDLGRANTADAVSMHASARCVPRAASPAR